MTYEDMIRMQAYLESFDPEPVEDDLLWVGWVLSGYSSLYPEITPKQLQAFSDGLPSDATWSDLDCHITAWLGQL